MKITGRNIESFLRRPACQAVLVYGRDQGLVRERARTMAATVVDDLDDPFRVTRLSGGELASDPARLADEANALSLVGGRRVVWVRDATDAAARAFEGFLAGPPAEALVVVEAGELGPRARLRRLFEGAESGAALACYADDERSLAGVIRETLAGRGLTASPEAFAFLVANLGADRMQTRNELEKLALYMGRPGAIGLADAMAAVGDSASLSLDAVVHAAASGERAGLDRALSRAWAEGASPIRVLRAEARHLARLHRAKGLIDKGSSPAEALKSLKPPVPFPLAEQVRRQLALWPRAAIADALGLLTEAEIACKTTGAPDRALSARALMRIAQAARRAGAARRTA